MTQRASKQQRMDLAFAALLSPDDATALTALTRIEDQGDARAIPHLLRALVRNPSPAVQARITALLHTVKTADAVTTLVTALDEPEFSSVRRTILAAFWSAGLDAREHLDRFIELALAGDAQDCFECLTVIENQEIWPEKAARQGAARVRKAVIDEAEPMKASMLRGIADELDQRLGA
ncbi:MAG: HEAT repeat domain-containing protein [Flavobacteriales bacterium]|nr:HEAT repeat domain-containing protein [Flavobacteriales bacterium]